MTTTHEHLALVAAHIQRGNAHQAGGRLEEALTCYREALRLEPDLAPAYINMGNTLRAQGKLDEAVASFREALRIQPDCAETYYNLGMVLKTQGKRDEGQKCVEQALQFKMATMEAGYREALRSNPENASVHYTLGHHLLLLGRFEEGWTECEWRLRKRDITPRSFPQPLWDGSPLCGKTILLHPEQGLGDTIHFIRYAPLLKEQGGTVVFECQAPLLRTLARSPGFDRILAVGTNLPPFDVQAPLLTLPAILRTTESTIPAPIPYVFADPLLEQHWRRELSGVTGLKVGISWQGNPVHPNDRQRSVAVTAFAPLTAVEGVHLFSLQVEPGREQLKAVEGQFAVTDLGGRFDRASFEDATAVMKGLDLVISVDTALVHLAGALGIPVWVGLSFVPDWRWQLGREDSPWYPSMRLFRQTIPGDWSSVFTRMAGELARMRG